MELLKTASVLPECTFKPHASSIPSGVHSASMDKGIVELRPLETWMSLEVIYIFTSILNTYIMPHISL